VDHAIRPALLQRHVQRGEHQIGCHAFADRPTHHTPAPHVQHDGQVDEACPGRHAGQVGHPQQVRRIGLELPLGEVRCRALLVVALGGHDIAAAAADTAQPGMMHRPGDALAADGRALLGQFRTDARHAVGGIGLGMALADAFAEHRIGQRSARGAAHLPVVEAAVRDTQHSAHRAHGEVGRARVHALEDGVNVLSPLAAARATRAAQCEGRRLMTGCVWATNGLHLALV
jgi:hypothetical protein